MAFLRNAWYAAAWASELKSDLLPRTILGEKIVLFRQQNSEAAALADRCPHRFVPLHRGKIKGDTIECGYHGLCFAADGSCTSNPHGTGAIPKAAVVKSYPVFEKYEMVWIWMGDPESADRAKLYEFEQFDKDSGFVAVRGYLHVDANYQLISDNLLDLTHGQYIHPMFVNSAGPPAMEESPFDEETVWARFVRKGQYPNKYFQMLGYPAQQLGDHRNYMRWNPPGNLLLDVGMTGVGAPVEEGISIPTAHLLTPETETSTHYFWGMARDFRKEDEQLSVDLLRIGMDIFNNEDKPIIEMQQRAMGTETDIFKLRPVLLSTDGAAVRARRLLAEWVANEASGTPQVATKNRVVTPA
jgi:phenylpropionate dioxygenase-like ring-hydroxylating dioxygenase large terminal subunit